jgi:hypothetical protein
MKIIYSQQSLSKLSGHSIFLAGPTPRDPITRSWRPDAIALLIANQYAGTVISPEQETRTTFDYDLQTEWEHEGLTKSKVIIFWVPRELVHMPAFTTNVEFGRFAHQANCLYGRPDNAPKNKYLDWYYAKVNTQPIYNQMANLLAKAIQF